MDLFRKILEFFSSSIRKEDRGMVKFIHEMEDEGDERIITVHADPNGFMIFSIFTVEEWGMVTDVCDITGRYIDDVIKEIAEDSNITTITIDPKDFN